MSTSNLKFKTSKLIACVSFSFLFSLFLFIPTSYAQQVNLSISPPIIEAVMKPGKSILIAYTLENFGDPAVITAKVLPFEPRDALGNIRIKDEFEGPIQFALDNANIQLEQPYFLKNRDSQQLLLRIRVPEGAPEGDYYYSLLNESEPPQAAEGQTASRAKATIGTNILITVTNSGSVDVKGRVALFDVLAPHSFNWFGNRIKFFDSGDKVPVVLQMQNSGKNILKPEGSIVMRGNFGEKATYDILPQNILSESQRLLTATPSASIDCDEGRNITLCKQPTSLVLSGFFLGSYQLSTTIGFGEGSPNLYASTSFIALPLKFMAGLLICILLGSIVFIGVRRKYGDEV